MRIVVLYNPNAGRGRGERVAASVRAMLETRGDQTTLLATAKEPPEAFHARVAAALRGADLLIVAGGDGTLHSTLPAVVGSGVPIYHLAMGTENLFARQFGMDRQPLTLQGALDAWRIVDVDVGELQVGLPSAGILATPFVLMCSLGPDASVIRRLDESRRGPISHLSYLKPVLAELLDPWLPRLTVEVDGERIADGVKGMLVVANSRQYAVRIDPAHRASMTDGLLDVAVFPCGGRVGALWTLARCRARRHGGSVIYKQGTTIRVHAEDPRPPALQIDGECRRVAPGPLELVARSRPGALRVLSPRT